MNYHHFKIEEREKVQQMLWQKASIRSIAKAIGRNPSSVYREIKRNKPPQRNLHTPRVAHQGALSYRKRRGREERLKNDIVRAYVVNRLKKRWSPEQIANTIQEAVRERISREAIYHAYERGSNENVNGLIRSEIIFPKGTDFTKISEQKLAFVEYERGCSKSSQGHFERSEEFLLF